MYTPTKFKEIESGVFSPMDDKGTSWEPFSEGDVRAWGELNEETGERADLDLYQHMIESGLPIEYLSDEYHTEQARQSLKAERDKLLTGLTYTFADGRTLQTRPQDAQNLQTAIQLGEPVDFVCADNSVAEFTVTELQEALNAGIGQAKAIWKAYTTELKAL